MILGNIFLGLAALAGGPSLTSIEAGHIHMQRKEWIADQEVRISNDMGDIFTEQAVIKEEKNTIHSIIFPKECLIHFKDASKIFSEITNFDFLKNKAVFHSKQAVMYQDTWNVNQNFVSIDFLAKKITCLFKEKKPFCLWGQENISFHINDTHHLLCDFLFYQKAPKFAFAWAKKEAKCRLWHNQEWMEADRLIFHGSEKEIQAVNAQGLTKFGDNLLQFQARFLHLMENELFMKSSAKIQEEHFTFIGPLLHIVKNKEAYPHKIYLIEAARGGTFEAFLNGSLMQIHALGPASFQRNARSIYSTGSSKDSLQITYENITASCISAHAALDENLAMQSLQLSGNIHIIWQNPSTGRQVIAIGDEMFWYPIEQFVILSANGQNKVQIIEENSALQTFSDSVYLQMTELGPVIKTPGSLKARIFPHKEADL
ncbi:MAG: hypothetical protein Tsb0015_15520 [Simkaniaceae bacterium]